MKSDSATHHSSAPEQTVADLAHLAWCALVALKLEQHEGQALSTLMVHTFLIRWLAGAQKQRRFPRSVAPDIESLLKLGRQKGLAAGLHQRLEYLLESCSSPVSSLSDLFQLTYAIEALKAQGWINAAVADYEWDLSALAAEYGDVSALLVRKSDLVRHFSDEGQLTGHVEFLVKGELDTVVAEFDIQTLRYTTETTMENCSMLTLLPV
ncbi:DUF2913 family protein [Enterobacter sp. A11]|uniref:DUF2913 family protein n=1 Tax=unclassified Enterobacter TaxID=2608935 RepID=UPI00107024C0|nr:MULTISPECIES: DUF2913 family protein [unclassified Enterobacter]MBM1020244.1 DUF2913 family protein [Enterobacter sp. E1]MEA3561545.1 DUF2913 family protein [Enterobacter sp. GM-22]MEA3595159.1 DUF2913 family protein [Enterobacter sp. GM-31]TFF60298.1 DUF2913 family protein [Enterobacter sp. A11]